MTPTIQHRSIIGQRPDIPVNWEIWNAPRPMVGTREWTGNFIHGIFYAAVNPEDDQADWMIQRNAEMDGWVLDFVTIDEAREWLTAEYIERYPQKEWAQIRETLAEFDDSEVTRAYYNAQRPR